MNNLTFTQVEPDLVEAICMYENHHSTFYRLIIGIWYSAYPNTVEATFKQMTKTIFSSHLYLFTKGWIKLSSRNHLMFTNKYMIIDGCK